MAGDLVCAADVECRLGGAPAFLGRKPCGNPVRCGGKRADSLLFARRDGSDLRFRHTSRHCSAFRASRRRRGAVAFRLPAARAIDRAVSVRLLRAVSRPFRRGRDGWRAPPRDAPRRACGRGAVAGSAADRSAAFVRSAVPVVSLPRSSRTERIASCAFLSVSAASEIFSDKDTEEYAEEEEIYEEPVKPIKNKRFKKNKKVTENVPETQPIWTGQTTAIDIIAPTSVDNGSRDYVVVDGIYHSYLYISGYGYRTHNEAAWMSALVEAGDSIGISFSFKRMQRDKILSRIAQKTMINRSKMRDVADTRSDFEELDSAISSGIYLKEGMNRGNQDFYYMSTIIEVTAEDEETLERNVSDIITLCASMDMVCKRADYKHEQGFLSLLPTVSLDADLERKSRRNVLTDSLAAAFPFSSFEVYDPEGIFIGLNKYNNSVAILDFFDADKYSNANACILGMTGAGKTFLMQIMALRLRQQGIQVFILAPLKGHEFAEVCNMIGGKYIRIAPSSMDCINIMEIRKRTLNTNYEIHGVRRNDSILAEKIQNLIIFFSLIKNDITQNELNLIDGAIVRTYKTFGITYDNDSLFD